MNDVQQVSKGLAVLSDQIEKAWSDKARAASLEARRNASAHATEARGHREAAANYKEGSPQRKAHLKAAEAHQAASDMYSRSAQHRDNGNRPMADDTSIEGHRLGIDAKVLSRRIKSE